MKRVRHIARKIKHLTTKQHDTVKSQSPTSFTPASSGDSMNPFIYWINTFSSLKVKNVFEIGANMAQDAEALRKGFNLKPSDVWVFEPHPELFDFIKKEYQFNAFDYAVSDKSGKVVMNLINPKKNTNSGISSMRIHKDVPKDDFIRKSVKAVRMDELINDKKIKSIDFLKLDVEGCNYEVLQGFGEQITRIKSLHVEAEHYDHWEGEKLWDDLRVFLEPHMELVFFERHFTQSDSLWIKKEYIKSNP